MTLLFSSALFLSACLLFWLELIFAKQVLPLLGGSPSVWNTCTLFYQTTLLAGYVYARATSVWLTPRRQVALHVGLWIVALWALPAAAPAGWTPSLSSPALSLLALAVVSIALPMFVLSTTGPLLQAWFARIRHRESKDPYFLYQASNLGSLAALASYPTIIEPHLTLGSQTGSWSLLFAFAAAGTAGCAAKLWSVRASKPARATVAAPSPAWALRLRWAALAFVPSSLMLGAATYLSSQIAPVPLLWVATLGLYLASFVVMFARRPWIRLEWAIRAQPFLLVPLALLMVTNAHDPTWLLMLFHLATLAVTALVCHGELARRRPPAPQLTDFYLWLAIGGALGGLFNAIVAPVVFKSVAEYPLTLVLAALVRARLDRDDATWADLAFPLALGLATAALPSILRSRGLYAGPLLLCLPALICFLFMHRPVRLGLGLGMLFLASLPYAVEPGRRLRIERSFFGVYRVMEYAETRFHLLTSGSIVHGGQNMDPRFSREPLAYYTRSGPLGQLFGALGVRREKSPIAVVGLGTGCMACYGSTGQSWIFYEIDPVVRDLAQDERYFTFLRDCPPRSEIILGDARLSLQQAPDRFYSWIVVDAFNSDAIPVHLLTSEALELYLSKLAPHGRLVFHISSHYLDLEPVLSALAKARGLTGLIGIDDNETPAPGEIFKSASQWVVLAEDADDLKPLDKDPRWRPLETPHGRAWTDDYSNLLGVVRWD